jgi:hypothetical protein
MILNDLTKHLLKEFTPYLIAFLLGVIVAWKGCGDTSGKTITTVIEKPIPTIEYVDRWKIDTVRFVSKEIVTVRDTITSEIVVNRLDTLFVVDTISIVEAWLTEIAKYDTTIDNKSASINLTWQNYQNRSEKLSVVYTPKKVPRTWSLGMHGIAALQSDFKQSYKPLFGMGIHSSIKKTYISAGYGYNGEHFISIGVGRDLITR